MDIDVSVIYLPESSVSLNNTCFWTVKLPGFTDLFDIDTNQIQIWLDKFS